MKKIYSIAIDDEPLALTVIDNFCKRYGNICLNTYSEPRTGLENIISQKPDLVFLDIEMNSLSGLDIARQIPTNTLFIFTTAHAQFALEGFNLDAVDFLHKPFSYERFKTAIDKVLRRIENSNFSEMKYLVVKQEYTNVNIPISDISYIEALGNYIKIYRTDGKYTLSHTNLKAVYTMLPEKLFIRIHRSYIISIKQIEKFTKNYIQLYGNHRQLPIGECYALQVNNILTNI